MDEDDYTHIIMVSSSTIDTLTPREFEAVRHADLAIVASTKRVIKDRYGVPGRFATASEIKRAVNP